MHNIKNDLILIFSLLLIIAIGILIYFCMKDDEEVSVYIYCDKELVTILDIKDNQEFEINDVILVVENEEVFVKSSICKDKICVHQGHIRSSGQTITCLPQRVVIQLVGKGVDVGI